MASERTKARPLDILGISESEERVYGWLLTNSGVTVPEIAQAFTLTAGKAQRLLDAIETKGLVTHSPERPRRYIPAAPDIAMEALIIQRQNDLQRARSAVQKLQERATAARTRDEQEQMVELITSHQAERQLFEQIQNGAIHEVATLVKLPVRITNLEDPKESEPQKTAQARGVRYRSINDAEFLASPDAVARVRRDMEAGEEIRTMPSLPLKILLADHRAALIPLRPNQTDSPVLLVRSSALLDALYALFEMLWERAAPISFIHGSAMKTGNSLTQFSSEAQELIHLLAAGLNDKKIATELKVSTRTLTRRLTELGKSLDACTRFQFGWQAALRLSDNSAALGNNTNSRSER